MMEDIIITKITFEELVLKSGDSSYFLVIHTNKEKIRGYFGPIYKPYIVSFLNVSKVIMGKNPLQTSKIWLDLWNTRIGGRSGVFMEFISAIDCALWDIKGKYFNCPTHELLGGSTREEINCYSSLLGYNENNYDSVEIANLFFRKGFNSQKWPIRRENHNSINDIITTIKKLTLALPKGDISFDFFGKFSIHEIQKILNGLKDMNITWIEEPISSEEISNINLLHTYISLAYGEHFSNIFEFKPIINNSMILYIQPDLGRCGGITTMMKILSLSEANGKIVIPHGHNLKAAICMALISSPNLLPLLEYHVTLEPIRQIFYKDPIIINNGKIVKQDLLGLGMDYDEDKIATKKIVKSVSI